MQRRAWWFELEQWLGKAKHGAVVLELAVVMELLEGGAVVEAFGAADAARRRWAPPRARPRLGLGKTRGYA